jgi:hypothetical protein
VDDGVGGRVVRVDGDCVTRVSAVLGRRLNTLATYRTKDENGLTVLELVEALEEVDATKRDPLTHAAVMAGIGDPGKQPSQHAAHGGIAQAG